MLLDYLETRVAAAPDSAGLRYRGTTTTYAALLEQAHRLTGGLAGQGLVPGDVVAVMSPNCPNLFALLFGIFGIGATAVPVHPATPSGELVRICQQTGASWLISEAGCASVAEAVEHALPGPQSLRLFTFDKDDAASLKTLSANPLGTLPICNPDTAAVYLFSSGSTGRPKLVPNTHGSLIGNGANTADRLQMSGDDLVFNSLPPSHSFGLTLMLRETLSGTASTLIWDDTRPSQLVRNSMIELMEAESVTVLPSVPFVLQQLARASTAASLGKLRLCFTAGVRLDRDTFDTFFDRHGTHVRQGYGTTETLLVAFNMDNDIERLWQSVGPAITGVDFELIPSPLCPDPDSGEILIRTPALAPGYQDADAKSTAQFHSGGFQPGDLARIDPDGNVFILGRSKLIYEIAGEKVDPIEVEDVLTSHPNISEAVVVTVPATGTGTDQLKAAVVGDSSRVDGKTLQRFCRSRLTSFKVPGVYEFVDEIPRSATGKILRGKLMN